MPFPNQGPQGAQNAGTDPAVIPLTAGSATAGTTAVALGTITDAGAPLVLVNAATTTVYVGNANVATSGANQGYALAPSAAVLVSYEYAPDYGGVSATLYGITASGTSVVTTYTFTTWPGIE